MKKFLLSLFMGFLISAPALAADEFRSVQAEELKKMMADRKVKVVDTRTAQEYMQGHIPGAVNLPPEQLSALDSVLPKNRKAPIVFYCRGIG